MPGSFLGLVIQAYPQTNLSPLCKCKRAGVFCKGLLYARTPRAENVLPDFLEHILVRLLDGDREADQIAFFDLGIITYRRAIYRYFHVCKTGIAFIIAAASLHDHPVETYISLLQDCLYTDTLRHRRHIKLNATVSAVLLMNKRHCGLCSCCDFPVVEFIILIHVCNGRNNSCALLCRGNSLSIRFDLNGCLTFGVGRCLNRQRLRICTLLEYSCKGCLLGSKRKLS